MKDKLYKQLLKSINEGGEILQGKIKPACEYFFVNPCSRTKITQINKKRIILNKINMD